MNQTFKAILRKVLPDTFLYRLLTAYTRLKTGKAREIFEQSPQTPAWMGWDLLELLQQKYPFPPMARYDPLSLEQRGEKRARELLRLAGRRKGRMRTFLDLGCWDGMVCAALQRMGKTATGVDIRPDAFDKRAIDAGAVLVQMDATDLRFENESFDFVFSYGSFEHFAEPERVLREAIRVVKKGGRIYLDFGALYMSPQGLHAYKSVTVPYRQFLFPGELLEAFAAAKGLPPIDFDTLNKWSLEDYRRLWSRCSDRLRKLRYYEIPDLAHIDLIMKYPSCFASKTRCFDNLIVTSVKVLFEKTG